MTPRARFSCRVWVRSLCLRRPSLPLSLSLLLSFSLSLFLSFSLSLVLSFSLSLLLSFSLSLSLFLSFSLSLFLSFSLPLSLSPSLFLIFRCVQYTLESPDTLTRFALKRTLTAVSSASRNYPKKSHKVHEALDHKQAKAQSIHNPHAFAERGASSLHNTPRLLPLRGMDAETFASMARDCDAVIHCAAIVILAREDPKP